MDHLQLSLENMLTRYQPPVPQHMYDLRFVPVVTKGSKEIPQRFGLPSLTRNELTCRLHQSHYHKKLWLLGVHSSIASHQWNLALVNTNNYI